MLHQTEIIVRGYHLDVYGHVNNARYLEFLEEARWAVCDAKKDLLAWFMQQKFALTVQRIEIDYKRAAMMGDALIVETEIVKRESKHWLVSQDIKRKSDDKIIVAANVFICIVSPNERGALLLEGELLQQLENLFG